MNSHVNSFAVIRIAMEAASAAQLEYQENSSFSVDLAADQGACRRVWGRAHLILAIV